MIDAAAAVALGCPTRSILSPPREFRVCLFCKRLVNHLDGSWPVTMVPSGWLYIPALRRPPRVEQSRHPVDVLRSPRDEVDMIRTTVTLRRLMSGSFTGPGTFAKSSPASLIVVP